MIVAIHGLKQSGKSTMADVFTRHRFTKLSFAGPLKAMLSVIGVPKDSLYGSDSQKNEPLPAFGGRSGRYLLQRLGTEFGREMVCPSLWTDILLTRAACHEFVVVDDLRFQSEFERIRAAGAFTIHLSRPGQVATDGHASEAGLNPDDFHLAVINDSSRDNLVNCAAWLSKLLDSGKAPLTHQYRTSSFLI